MFAWGLRHVNVYTVAAGGEGRRQGPKRQLTLTRVDVTKVYYKIHHFERYALWWVEGGRVESGGRGEGGAQRAYLSKS